MVNNPLPTNAYAIDFGTSNTAIARWNSATARAEIVKLAGFSQQIAGVPPLIPSLVYVEDASQDRTIVGQKVRDRGLDMTANPRFFRSFKRGIGSEIQGFLPELDGQTLSFERVGEWFLQSLLDNLQAQQNEKIDSLVLTVPVDSFEAYRHWLSGICESSDIAQIRMIDEPTAAALGYGTADRELLLVLDFGGGTLDLSLVQLAKTSTVNQGFILKWGGKMPGKNSAQKKATARVLAKAGQNLGGTDIDNWLVDYFARERGLPKSSLVTRLAEKLKIQLSTKTEAQEVYFDDETLETYDLSLSRDRFEEILQQQEFFARLDDLMVGVLQQARRSGIEASDIDAVLLVGGSAQIPAVQNWIGDYFDEAMVKKDRHFSAIASGALQLAQGYEIKDFLYHSYGIRYWNRVTNAHSWHPIIKEGQPYPTNEPVEIVLGASIPNQTKVELVIGELGAESSTTEVYFDGDRLVTRASNSADAIVKPLNDSDGARTIAQLNPVGNPGTDRLKLTFSVDEQCYLRLMVEDLLTQETLLNHYIVSQLN